VQTKQTRPRIGGRWRTVTAVAAAGVLAATLAACGGSESDSSSVTVTFRQFGNDRVMENFLKDAKAEF
jgi:ABC-type glycerol-3-phosphate transport system substrate-binding protein